MVGVGAGFLLIFLVPIACIISVFGILLSRRGVWFIRVLWALASIALPFISAAVLMLLVKYQFSQVAVFPVAVLVYVGSLLVWFLFVKCTPLKEVLHNGEAHF